MQEPPAAPQATATGADFVGPTAQTPATLPPQPVTAGLSVTITSLPATHDGGTATAAAKTAAGASCSIDVEYASGPSTAAGLGHKVASSKGLVSWSWKVGAKTTLGAGPVTVTCTKGSASGSATKPLVLH